MLKFLVVAGPSGAGKGTLLQKLRETFPDAFGFSVSCTSRIPRSSEQNGVHYTFVSREEFLNRIAKQQFVEYAENFGNFYGTPVSEIERNQKLGKICLLEIDVQGVHQVKASAWGNQANYMFIVPPSIEELERRLRERRTEDEEKLKLRLSNAKELMAMQDRFGTEFDRILVNDKLDECFEELRSQVLV